MNRMKTKKTVSLWDLNTLKITRDQEKIRVEWWKQNGNFNQNLYEQIKLIKQNGTIHNN